MSANHSSHSLSTVRHHQLDSAGWSAGSSPSFRDRLISTMAGGTSPGSWKGFAFGDFIWISLGEFYADLVSFPPSHAAYEDGCMVKHKIK